MSWHFLQEQAEASWEGFSLDGAPSALLKLIPIAEEYSLLGSEMASFLSFPSGTMCARSMVGHGEDMSISSVGDSRVRDSLRRVGGAGGHQTSGHTCGESSKRLARSTSSSKTSQPNQSSKLPRISTMLVFVVAPQEYPPPAWLRHTDVQGIGWLPTPTKRPTCDCPSMRKWPAHQRLFAHFGPRSLTPSMWEWIMGWPIGWTDLEPLGMDKFQQWFASHGRF